MNKVSVSIIEDENIIRLSLTGLIRNHPKLILNSASHSIESFMSEELNHSSDVMLLDIGLKGGMSGLEGIRLIKQKYPDLRIIILTAFDDSDKIFKALCAGASAYLTKDAPFVKIAEAIHTVYQGGSYMSPGVARKIIDHFAPKSNTSSKLTPRQHQIAQGIIDCLSYKMIGDKLMISTETVRDHIKKIYRKLEIHSRTELIKKSLEGEL